MREPKRIPLTQGQFAIVDDTPAEARAAYLAAKPTYHPTAPTIL